MKQKISVRVNEISYEEEVEPRQLLVYFLREQLGLTGAHVGCVIGECGACSVLVAGKIVKSCLMLAVQANGRQITTIEGLAQGDKLHPLQEAFIERGGFQCGYCTSGMILLAKTLLDQKPNPTRKEIQHYMDANICRCTGYQMILESIMLAAEKMAGKPA